MKKKLTNTTGPTMTHKAPATDKPRKPGRPPADPIAGKMTVQLALKVPGLLYKQLSQEARRWKLNLASLVRVKLGEPVPSWLVEKKDKTP